MRLRQQSLQERGITIFFKCLQNLSTKPTREVALLW
nr:MAG TPA: hypothetical protein [Caudoviricetes sp.]